MTAAEIAKKLTPAMRASLLRRPCRSWWTGPEACMPLSLNTESALGRRGLLAPGGYSARVLTPLGRKVRAIIDAEARDA